MMSGHRLKAVALEQLLPQASLTMVDDSRSADEGASGAGSADEHACETGAAPPCDGAAREVVERVLKFVQEQPWVAVAGAFVLGYVAAQFVKRLD